MKIQYKKSLGQHFIKDQNIHNKIVLRAGDITNYNIVEIGPGDGGLSQAILRQNPKKLLMIEKDKSLIPILQNNFENLPNVEIIQGDALSINIQDIVQQPIKIIANLPYNISTSLILNWLSKSEFFTSITVLVQKEVAERFAAKVGDSSYGRVTVLTNLVAEVKKEFNINPKAFVPPPKVESTLITFTPFREKRFNISWDDLSSLTRIVFSHPRKTIYNNLRNEFSNVEEILRNAEIDKTRRPETLSLKEFVEIHNEL